MLPSSQFAICWQGDQTTMIKDYLSSNERVRMIAIGPHFRNSKNCTLDQTPLLSNQVKLVAYMSILLWIPIRASCMITSARPRPTMTISSPFYPEEVISAQRYLEHGPWSGKGTVMHGGTIASLWVESRLEWCISCGTLQRILISVSSSKISRGSYSCAREGGRVPSVCFRMILFFTF